MTIFVEIESDRLVVSYSDLPRQRYQTNLSSLICDAASEPYRRGERRRWFAGTSLRPPLTEMNGRPC